MQELEEEMEAAKQAWLKKQRSMRDKASGNKSKEVQALNKQLQAALQVLDVERYHVAACEEAAMPAEKGPGRHAPQHAPASIDSKFSRVVEGCMQLTWCLKAKGHVYDDKQETEERHERHGPNMLISEIASLAPYAVVMCNATPAKGMCSRK